MINRKLVLALEIGRDSIKGIKFHSSLKGLRFKGTGFTPIIVKEGEDWKKAAIRCLKGVFSENRPDRTEVISLLPGHLFFQRNYTFPITNHRRVKQVIPFEMEGDIPLPLEDVVIDSMIRKGEGGSEVLAFALPKEILKEYIGLFPNGFKPKVVIPDFVGLSFLKVSEQKKDIGILEVGYEKLTLVATRHRRLKRARSISLSKKRGFGEREMEELISTLREWKAIGIDVERIYLCGNNVKEVDKEDLARKLGIDMEGQVFTKGKERGRDVSDFASLIGAGYMDMDINLLRSEEEAKRMEASRKRMVASSIGLIILLVLGLTDLFMSYFFLKSQYNSIKLEVRNAFQEVMPEVRNIVNEESQLMAAIKQEKANLLLIKGGTLIDLDPLWVFDFFFERPLGGTVVITEARVEDEISFQGEAKNQVAVDAFIDELSRKKEIHDVRIQRVEHVKDYLRFRGKATLINTDSAD